MIDYPGIAVRVSYWKRAGFTAQETFAGEDGQVLVRYVRTLACAPAENADLGHP